MENKTHTHTPGPWIAGPVFNGQTRILAETGTCAIVGTPTRGQCAPSAEEATANARLIAAAPDLLAALYNLATWIDATAKGYCAKELHSVSLERYLAQTRAAIAKAEGGEQ